MKITTSNGYGFFRLSREFDGECDHARRLLAYPSSIALDCVERCGWRARLSGPTLRLVIGSAQHTHGTAPPWLEHKLIFKSGIGCVAKPMAAVEIISFLG